jgi:mannose-1-phosphate guanylyltransferase/mannose-6-phosphate isomerase
MTNSPTIVTPVILCGGSGTRLWPLSRTGFPKQFLCLTGHDSLFQQAAKRLTQLEGPKIKVSSPMLVTGEEHRFLAAEQLREAGITLGHALLEPEGRNTAPALTLAALAAFEVGQDPVLVVTPSDQTVSDNFAFVHAMQEAIQEAALGSIVILGVTPNRPEIGYGYIQIEESLGRTILPVKRFVEKPDEKTAQSYLEAGGYYWNAGIFVLKASIWLKSLERFRPDIFQTARSAWNKRLEDGQFIRPDAEAFKAVPSESIDYAVMEQATDSDLTIKMVPLDAGWSDLGSWDAVLSVLPKDKNGNAHVGDVLLTDSRNTLVHATSRLVSLVGVNDLIVIETPDAIMVTDRIRSQDVKNIVKKLSEQGRAEHTLHRKVHRPWGWYDSVDGGDKFKVKRICVKSGASLSLQLHHHRSEHWIVVSGTAEVTRGNDVFILKENESTFIQTGQVHRLRNLGVIELELIEVQSGDYLGEDDIVRLEDNYGRVKGEF